jgi:hypothetical protein
MTRITSYAVLLAATLVACDLGTAALRTDGGGGGGGDGGSGGSDAPNAVAAHDHCTSGVGTSGCLDTTNPSNAGQDCEGNGTMCHASGGQGGTYAFMGTMCAATPCTAPAVGVTVTFGTVTATTDTAGNFYVGAGSSSLVANSTSTQGGFEMGAGSSPAPAADCNQSGCHQALSTQTFPPAATGAGGNGSVYN